MDKPTFLTLREIRRYRKRGAAAGAAAIKAVSPERKPGKRDMRDCEEQLVDILCSLRQWADANEVNFHEVCDESEFHFRIETGEIAENSIQMI